MTAVDVPTQSSTPTEPARPDRSRRQVLCGLALALVAPGVVVAACGTGSTATSSTTGAGTTGTTGAGATTGGAAGGALAALADVPQGGGTLVDKPGGGKLLLVRPTADEVKAFDPTCPHQGVTVAPPRNGVITCPGHGSQFDGSTGALKKGPAPTGLTEVKVKVDGGNVVLA